jgi:ribulose-5-phosphate 4-epimerase/fuculose-1-phosphate aldolase
MTKMNISPQLVADFMEISHRISARGLTTGTSGGISIRVPESENILLKGFGVASADLKEKDIALVDPSGKPLNGVKPCLETQLHLAVLRARKNIGAVIHAHAPFATAFGNVKRELEQGVLKKNVKSHDYLIQAAFTEHANSGSEELAKNVAKPFQKENVICAFMEDHGVTVVGSDIYKAYNNLDKLEGKAKSFILTMLLRGCIR